MPATKNKPLARGGRRSLKEGTTAVLIANGYKWRCPGCGHDNYNQRAKEAASCTHCYRYYSVQLVFHTSKDQPISPGSRPSSLYRQPMETTEDTEDQAEHAVPMLLADGDINMTVTGYSWRCPECDTSGYRKNAAFKNVICGKCSSQYAISEIRHRLSEAELAFGQYPGALWQLEALDTSGLEAEDEKEASSIAEMPEDTPSPAPLSFI